MTRWRILAFAAVFILVGTQVLAQQQATVKRNMNLRRRRRRLKPKSERWRLLKSSHSSIPIPSRATIASAGRPAADRRRHPTPGSGDGGREPALGRASNPWGIGEAAVRRLRADGFSADAAAAEATLYDALDAGILPGRTWGGVVVREGLAKLLAGPRGCGMPRHVDVQDAATSLRFLRSPPESCSSLERTSRSARTPPRDAPSIRSALDRSWRGPKSAGSTIATNGKPPESGSASLGQGRELGRGRLPPD